MQAMEVRCCCTPKKLLGTLPVPFGGVDQVTFLLGNLEATRRITLGVHPFAELDSFGVYSVRRCLKAEDVSIETLRRIPGFEEAR